jgi:hypothetical protein
MRLIWCQERRRVGSAARLRGFVGADGCVADSGDGEICDGFGDCDRCGDGERGESFRVPD